MGEIGRTIHVRLSAALQKKLEHLHGKHFAGLPVATVAKLLLCNQLRKDEEALVTIMREQINTPSEEEAVPKNNERLTGLNTNKRRIRR